jgi:hypothetical protein
MQSTLAETPKRTSAPAIASLILASARHEGGHGATDYEVHAPCGSVAEAVEAALERPLSSCLLVTAGDDTDIEGLERVLAGHLGPDGRLDRVGTEGLLRDPETEEHHDAILVVDPAWSGCAIGPLSAAHRRLRAGGVLVFIGLARTAACSDGCEDGAVVLPYLSAQARRCGFSEIETHDFSKSALALLAHAEKGSGAPEEIDAAKVALAIAGTLFVVGQLRKTTEPRWLLRAFHPEEAEVMRDLFAEVFAPNAMSEAHWQWKYGDGRGRGMAAWRDGKMVAFYGGLPRQVSFKGRLLQAMQIVDVMVQAGERGVLRREGAFFQTAASFLECYVGSGAEALVGYGFPTARALEVAERLRLYCRVGEVRELSWTGPSRSSHRAYLIESVPGPTLSRHARAIDRLWDGMRLSLSDAIVGVRDWAFVRRRFVAHPEKPYRYVIARHRWTRRTLALMVLSVDGEICHLRDYVGDPRRLPLAIEMLRGYADREGMTTVKTWITQRFVDAFPTADRTDRAIDLFVPHSTCTFGPTPEEIDGHWWLMGGDTDFL